MRVLQTVFATARVQMINTFNRPVFRFAAFIQPLIFVTITYFMFQSTGRSDLIVFVVIGSGIAGLWSSIIYSSAGDIERERHMGTLESLFLAPVNFRAIMLGKVLGNSVLGLGSLVISVLYARLFFGIQVTVMYPAILLLGLTLLLFSGTAMALLLAPFFTLSRSSSALMNGLEYPLFVLSGILFPVEKLPTWLKPVSMVLAPTWAMRVIRRGFEVAPSMGEVWTDLLILVGITTAYLLGMRMLYRMMERRVRITGSLGVE